MATGKSALKIVQKYHPEVRRVVDAKKNVDIEVTAQDCKGSRRMKPDACAMARAFGREYDGAIISMSTAYLVKGKTATRYKVPGAVSREIVSFDRNRNFAPGEYQLRAPSATARMGWRYKPTGPHKTHKTHQHKTAGIRSL
jgi:hypothetical protein